MDFLNHQEVWRLDPQTGTPTGTAASGPSFSGIAWSSKAVWAGEGGGSLLEIEPKLEQVTRIHIGEAPTGVAVGYGLVWTSVEAPST